MASKIPVVQDFQDCRRKEAIHLYTTSKTPAKRADMRDDRLIGSPRKAIQDHAPPNSCCCCRCRCRSCSEKRAAGACMPEKVIGLGICRRKRRKHCGSRCKLSYNT